MSNTPKKVRTEALPTITIGTNKYTEAKTRVAHVAKNFDYEVETSHEFIESLRLWIVKAKVTIYEDGKPYTYTGTAKEYENKIEGDVNSTSALENAETSAVGRALAFAGIGIETAIASGDEMKAVERAGGKVKGTKPAQEAKAEESGQNGPTGNSFDLLEFTLGQIEKCETMERLEKMHKTYTDKPENYDVEACQILDKAFAKRRETLKKRAQRAKQKENGNVKQ